MNYKYEIYKILNNQINGDYSKTLTKYSYILGANDFISFTHNPDYNAFNYEYNLLKEMKIILQSINIKNIYELGPGNGEKTRYLLNTWINHPKYTAIDISQSLLKDAKHNN